MSISREEQFAALQEAQRILQLEKKWRRLVPDERKPDFKRAARVILQRALGHKSVGREPTLRVHSGLMHEHDEREAQLIERTLRNGIVHPAVLSFRFQGAQDVYPGDRGVTDARAGRRALHLPGYAGHGYQLWAR